MLAETGATHGLSGVHGANKDTDGNINTQGHTVLKDTYQSSSECASTWDWADTRWSRGQGARGRWLRHPH